MILYPAIDLKDGNAVRLLHGDMDQATVFNTDPVSQAMEFVKAGCEWLHLVDLNGAFAGEPVNAAPVEAILAQTKTPAQLGGGIRDMKTIETWLKKGLTRVILGTVAVERPELVLEVRYDQLEKWRFRHTVQFVRWREDRDPRSCTYDQLETVSAYDVGAVLES